jgi:hypothetical protein
MRSNASGGTWKSEGRIIGGYLSLGHPLPVTYTQGIRRSPVKAESFGFRKIRNLRYVGIVNTLIVVRLGYLLFI